MTDAPKIIGIQKSKASIGDTAKTSGVYYKAMVFYGEHPRTGKRRYWYITREGSISPYTPLRR